MTIDLKIYWYCFSDVRFWAGWSEPDEEGMIVSANNQSKMLGKDDFQPWFLGEPNGYTAENCLIVTTPSGVKSAWFDTSCETKECFFCNISRMPILQIRGQIIFFA